MGQDIKISIIMPVYKVEKYVGKAIESMQAQTLSEFEFLIVDDGTPDKSGIICDEYAAKDARIQVIHKENGGAPSARNAVLPLARGKYIYFMDSDDWAEPTMLEEMYILAEENSAQLVVAGFYIDTYYSENEYLTDNLYIESAVYKTQEEFRRNAYKMFDKNLLYTPWNKLFSAAYLKSINARFPETFWDDFPFTLSVIKDIEHVAVTRNQYYHFIRARAESETAAYRPEMYKRREEENEWLVGLYKYWKVNDENSKEMVARRYIERFIGCVENLTNPNCKMPGKEKRECIKKMLNKHSVKWSLKHAKPRSGYMKLLLIPVKMNSVILTLLEAKLITYVKTHNTKIFARLKGGR